MRRTALPLLLGCLSVLTGEKWGGGQQWGAVRGVWGNGVGGSRFGMAMGAVRGLCGLWGYRSVGAQGYGVTGLYGALGYGVIGSQG